MTRRVIESADGAPCGLEVHVRQRAGDVYQMARVHDDGDRSSVLTAYEVNDGVLVRAEHQGEAGGRADVMIPTDVFDALGTRKHREEEDDA